MPSNDLTNAASTPTFTLFSVATRTRLIVSLLFAATLGIAGCERSPETVARNGGGGGGGVNTKATDYNKTLDGFSFPDVVTTSPDTSGVTDSGSAQDAGGPGQDSGEKPEDSGVITTDDTTAGDDTGGQNDAGAVDTNKVDAGSSDTGSSDTYQPPVWPAGSLKVQSAFSPDGKGVKVRFNKPPDATGATCTDKIACKQVFLIQASNNDTVPVLNAKPAADPRFASLTLDPGVKINPQLTYVALVKNLKAFDGENLDSVQRKAVIKRTVYLHLMFHQHQPTYEDPIQGTLTSPWVRKHATKDYYDMASVLLPYPKVHLTMNLTAVLIKQLKEYYLDRLGPYVDTKKNTVDTAAFLAKHKGHTDPWIDLLLEPTPTPQTVTAKQLGLLYADPWSCVSTSPVLMKRFPDYEKLREKNPATLTQQDFMGLKIWFELAWFDPDFLNGAVTLATGDVIDLTDILKNNGDGTYSLKVPLSDQLANRIVAEEYKIMAAVLPIHKQMAYEPDKGAKGQPTGQLELTTTPFYHPILPLIHDTNLMGPGQPFDPKPAEQFAYPADANAQVAKAVAYFEEVFGFKPRGMWPGEGSVAEAVVKHFVNNGLLWVATDQQVMEKSGQYTGGSPTAPYAVDNNTTKGLGGGSMGVYFRNTSQSNDIGFKYQGMTGDQSSDDLIKNVTAQAPTFGAPDRVITLILDGENAWETFSKEHDGKGFFHKLYSKLGALQDSGEIISVTGSEYILGNPTRNVPAHPVNEMAELEPLFPGSWIGGNFNIWIGESEENAGWAYLLTARKDLEKSGLKAPDPYKKKPTKVGSLEWEIWLAWEEMYGAEGSDWFWWYGADMTSPSNDDSPFDTGFRTHLAGMYQHMNLALKLLGKAEFTMPDFKPIIQAAEQLPQGPLEPAPTLDGKFTPNESEWSAKGGFFFDSDTNDAQANPDDWIAATYYGTNKTGFYVAVQHNFDLSLTSGELLIYLSHKHIIDEATGQSSQDPAVPTMRYGGDVGMSGAGAARELRIKVGGGKAALELRKSDGKTPWAQLATSPFGGAIAGPLKGGKLIEVKVPWQDLGLADGDPLEVRLVWYNGTKAADTAPTLAAKQLIDDPTNAVFVTLACDVSEKSGIKVDTFGWIATQPAPKGKGIVYVAGAHPKLGMKTKWVPNKIALRDDGKGGDKVANDEIWSRVFAFPRGTKLRYKYTIGLPKDEGQWGGTEEFPLTERGLDITKDPKTTKMLVSDVFADRPQPSGTAGGKTVVVTD